MVKLTKILLLLFCFSVTVYATDVIVLPTQLPNSQISGLPSAVTGNASVTNGSATVTITSNFRTSWIGISGFRILLGSTTFYVLNAASGGVLTLDVPYTGISGTVPYTVYPFIYLQIYASMAYTPLGKGYVVQPGAPGSSQFYQRKACSIISGQMWIPQMVLDATTDAVNPAERGAKLAAFFYRTDNSLISPYAGFESFFVRPEPQTSWTAISSYNQAGSIAPPDNRYYYSSQIDSMLPVCSPGQMVYFNAAGRVQSCLNVGAGLILNTATATLSSTGGGGGGGPTVWSALQSPGDNLTLAHSNWRTIFQWSANTGGNTLFSVETAANDTGSNYLFQVSTPGTSNTKRPLRVSAKGLESLIVDAAGHVGINDTTSAAQLSVSADATSTTAVRIAGQAGASSDLLQIAVGGAVGPRFVPGTMGRIDSVLRSGTGDLTGTEVAGYVHIASTATAPTAVPNIYSGAVPLTWDKVGKKLWVYDAGWTSVMGGTTGGSTTWTAKWIFQNQTSGTPAAGDWYVNNAAMNTATQLAISQTTDGGVDWANFLLGLLPGDLLYLQNEDDATQWIRYKIEAPGTDAGTYWTFTVSLFSWGGINITDNKRCVVVFTTAGAGGAGSGVTSWSNLTSPSAPLPLSMGANVTTFTYSASTGSNDLFNFTTSTNDNGINYLLTASTPGSGNTKRPFRISAQGLDTFQVNATGKIHAGATTFDEFFNISQVSNATTFMDGLYVSQQFTGANQAAGAFGELAAIRAFLRQSATGSSTIASSSVLSLGYQKDVGTTTGGAIGPIAMVHATPAVINESAQGVYGMILEGPVVAAGKMIGDWIGLSVSAPSGAGITGNRIAIATDPQAGSVGIGGVNTGSMAYILSDNTTKEGLRVDTQPNPTADIARFNLDGSAVVRFVPVGTVANMVLGAGAVGTAAADGFVYLPTTSNQPSGNPTAYTGLAPLVIENDTLNSQYFLWGFINNSWRNLTGTGGVGSTSWSSLTSPSGALPLAHSANTTTMTWNVNSGSANMWTFTNTAGNTGHSGYLVSIETPGAGNGTSPFRVVPHGNVAFEVDGGGSMFMRGETEITPTGNASTALYVNNTGIVGSNVARFRSTVAGSEVLFLEWTNPSVANALLPMLEMQARAIGTPNIGFGSSLNFAAEDSVHNITGLGQISYAWRDPTSGATRSTFRISTASGASNTTPTVATGDRLVITGRSVVLDNSPTELFRFTLTTGQMVGGDFSVTVIARGSTSADIQVYTAVVMYRCMNSSGTISSPVTDIVSQNSTVSSGTLTCSFANNTTGSDGVIRIQCDSSFSAPNLMSYVNIRNNAGEQITVP